MLDTLGSNAITNAVPAVPASVLTIGADLRRSVEADPATRASSIVRRIGELDVQLVREGNKWRLSLADLVPIPHTTRDLWATAVSAPSVEWSQTPDGCSVWCQWTEQSR